MALSTFERDPLWLHDINPKARFGCEVGVGYNYLISNMRE